MRGGASRWAVKIMIYRKEGNMSADFHRFHLGNYECVSLYDGYNDYKLEEMVANAPQVDVEVALRAHGFSPEFVTTPFSFLYINTGKNRILTDIGAGNLLPTTGNLLHNIQRAGIAT